MRLLILILVLLLIAFLVRRALEVFSAARDGSPTRPDKRHGNTMARCDVCGLYVPSQEAVRGGGKTFCSNAHLKAFIARQDD